MNGMFANARTLSARTCEYYIQMRGGYTKLPIMKEETEFRASYYDFFLLALNYHHG